MTTFAQLVLFLSSYAPLLVVFALLDSFGKGWPSLICAALAIAAVLMLIVVLTVARRVAPQPLHVRRVQIRDGDALAYIATYLVPFAAVSLATGRERLALLLFVLLIAVVYVRSGLFYVNPLLALVGYRLYQVTTPKGATVILLTRRSFLRADTELRTRRLSDYVYWEVSSDG